MVAYLYAERPNIERAARSADFETRLWAQFEREQRAQDRVLETALIAAARRRSLGERRIRQGFTARLAALRARRDAAGRLARSWLRQRYAPDAEELRRRHEEERAALSKRQRRVLSRLATIFDITGRTKKSRAAERQALISRHNAERQALAAEVRKARQNRAQAIGARYQTGKAELDAARAQALARLQEGHAAALQHEDRQRQTREAEREQARIQVQAQIDGWRRMQRAQEGRERSKAGQAWDTRHRDGISPEDQTAAARRRMKQAQGRPRQRNHGCDGD